MRFTFDRHYFGSVDDMMNNGEILFNIDALAFVGFLPPDGKPISRQRIIWFIFTIVQFVIMNILMFVKMALTEFSMGVATNLVTQSVNLFQTLFQRFYFTYKINKISALVEEINVAPDCACVPFTDAEREMRGTSTQRIKNFSRLVFAFNATVILLNILRVTFASAVSGLGCQSSAECGSGHALLYDIWWPGDPSAPPTYYLIMVWQFATLMTNVSNVAATDAFACALMLAAAERSNLLSEDAPNALLPGTQGKMTTHCRAWLRYHQYYLRIVSELNAVMGPVFFTTYLVAGVNIISLSYVSVKVSDPGVLAGSIAILAVLLVRLFTFAYAGQCVLSKSEDLSRCSLSATQVAKGGLKDGPARTTLLVLVTRLSGGCKPEEVSGLGYFAISMEFFTKLLSVSVSYLLILLQLQ